MNRIKSLLVNVVISIISVTITLILVSFTASNKDDLNHLKKSNKFKYELIQHQEKLINYQDEMINSLEYTLWNEYNDDCAQFDGDEQYNINKEKNIIDSLNNSQL